MYIDRSRLSDRARLGTALLALILGLTLGTGTARAYDPAKTPAKPVESGRWGALKPTGDPLGDTSGFEFHRDPRQTEPFFFGVDIENGWMFVPTGRGLQIYNTNVNPGQPSMTAYGYGPNPATQASGGLMPVWYHSDEDFFLKEADAPAGVDSIVAVASYGQGVTIWNTSAKDGPSVHYQDDGVGARAIYAATFGTKKYAIAGSSRGAYLYDLDEAAKKTKCLDSSQVGSVSCGVYKGKFGTVAPPSVIHGVGPFVAFGTSQAFEIWNASNPTAPSKVMQVSQPARGIAMWQEGSSFYLAIGNSGKVRIYDVSCISLGACNLPVELKLLDVPGGVPPISRLTFSRASGGVPYLYVSGEDSTTCAVQREYLFNVSNPSNPVEITPDPTPEKPGGYWGWYYYGCDTGFNWVSPMAGKFNGNYFYRAAYSILDVHQLVGAQPPTANFSFPDAVYANVPVQFTDLSSGSPAPDQWDWNFGDGQPGAALENDPVPPTVTFGTVGERTVTLRVHNTEGWSPAVPKKVNVLNPKPEIGNVTVSPANPVRCQPVTFTGTGVVGLPTLTHSWALPNAVPAPGSPNASTLVWNTTASTVPGTYTATLTVTNAHGSFEKSVTVNLGDLQTINPTFAPTNEPFTAGTVKFDDNQPAGSATEWSWDFDDDENPATSQWTAWSNDPILGPSPTHAYTETGVKNVRVRVKNCTTPDQVNGIVSGALQITITQVTPLKGGFSPVCFNGFCFFDVGQVITFIDQSTGAEFWDYDWDGDGVYEEANNTAPKTTHVYTKVGTYTPKLRVRRGASEQDIYTSPTPMSVGPATPPTISVSGPNTGQPNAALAFTASGGGSCQPAANGWSWSSSGGTVTNGTTESVTITWTTNGPKTVTVTNSACGSTSGSKTVTIGTGTPPPPPPPPPPGGLKAEFSFSPAAPAVNQAVAFNAAASTGAPTSYTWDFGDGSAFGSGVQVNHTYTKTGTFTVQLVIAKPGNCAPAPFCDSVATKTVTVGTGEPPLIASFQSNASCITDFGFNVCTAGVGQQVAFTSTSTGGPTSWSWTFGDGQSANGASVTHAFNQPGTFTVTLTVGKGSNTATASMTFNVSGEAPLGASFTTSAACAGNTCAAETGQAVTFTSTSTGGPASQTWAFGDGQSGNGASVTHTYSQPGTYNVTLTIGKGANTATASKTFNVTGVVQPEAGAIVLPWVAQSRGVLQQSSNLYIHNPGTTPLEVTLEFRRQGTPEANPPRAALTIQPGATQYVVDVLKGLFKVENTVGFVTITKTKGDRDPVMTSFNNIAGKKGSQYGQTIPSVRLGSGAAATTGARVQNLVGLSDNGDRQAYFGITNPNPTQAVYRLKFYDSLGRAIGTPSADLTLPSFGQRQFQLSEIRSLFGISTEDDYRVEVETVSGGNLYPYGTNVQTVSKDPSFQGVGRSKSRLYLIGAMRTKGLNKSEWQSDVVLANTGTQVALADVSFLNAGPSSQLTAPIKLTLQPGQTERLENVGRQWNVKDAVGLLVIESDAPDGVFPIVQGESYLSTKGKAGARYGLAMAAFTDEDAAEAGEAHHLVGLRHDTFNRTTVWLLNPTLQVGTYDLIYRGLDGKILGRLDNVTLGAAKMRQIGPTQHPLKAVGKKSAGVPGGFTIQIVVKSGKALAAAQVVNNKTNDPAYVQGETR